MLLGERYYLILEAVNENDYREVDYVRLDNIEIINRLYSEIESLSDVSSEISSKKRSTCLNGGTCTSLGKKSFRCSCADDFMAIDANSNFRAYI